MDYKFMPEDTILLLIGIPLLIVLLGYLIAAYL